MREWFKALGPIESSLRILTWLWKGVFWGFFPILLSAVLPIFWGHGFKVPSDALFALSVLAIAICATQVEFPSEKSTVQPRLREWLPRLTNLIIFLAVAISIASNKNITYLGQNPHEGNLTIGVIIIFLFSLIVSLTAFIVNEIIEEKHIQSLPEERSLSGQALADSARKAESSNGITL